MTVKADAELQHTLAHLYLAIEALAEGCRASARAELQVVASAIFYDDLQDQERHMARCRCRDKKRPKKKRPKKKKRG